MRIPKMYKILYFRLMDHEINVFEVWEIGENRGKSGKKSPFLIKQNRQFATKSSQSPYIISLSQILNVSSFFFKFWESLIKNRGNRDIIRKRTFFGGAICGITQKTERENLKKPVLHPVAWEFLSLVSKLLPPRVPASKHGTRASSPVVNIISSSSLCLFL